MKGRKQQITERMELLNQEIIRTLEEKETYKYLGILETDTIKQEDIKEKKLKRKISGERESYSKPNIIAGTLKKG